MAYFLYITSIATYIEARIKTDISYYELEKITGYSYRHIREIFKECTSTPLSKYILERRLSNAAFDIIHTHKRLIDIAFEYKFNNYDTFCRAFRRHTNVTPSEFRSNQYKVGRRCIAMGLYAPVIYENEDSSFLHHKIQEDFNMNSNIEKNDTSCILYGVPKVAYSFEECTPFPVALKACLNYMGQSIDYTYIMAVSGAAFRLRWNLDFWDGGNVDIMNIYNDAFEVFRRSFDGVGRTYSILKRCNSTKQDFINFIKSEIDEGRPVIALGIIGPPEACVITGYRENGNTLLGWNCFQNNAEFAKGVSIDISGYFICDNWWENKDTIALMSIGEKEYTPISQKDIIKNAINILTTDCITVRALDSKNKNTFAGGQNAYDKWATSITNEKDFPSGAITPLLFERLMCQNDAQTMVGEGRSYAACFMEWVGRENQHISSYCTEAAKHFRSSAQCVFDMNELKGGFEQNEKVLKKFSEPQVRKGISALILKAKKHEQNACNLLQIIYQEI